MSRLWEIRQYVSNSGEGAIDERLAGEQINVEIKFHERLRHISQMTIVEWHPDWAKQLSGRTCKGLSEIRFKANKVQHRPIFFLGPRENQITVVFWAIEKGDKFVPKATCRIAQERKNEILQDHAKSATYEYE